MIVKLINWSFLRKQAVTLVSLPVLNIAIGTKRKGTIFCSMENIHLMGSPVYFVLSETLILRTWKTLDQRRTWRSANSYDGWRSALSINFLFCRKIWTLAVKDI